MSRRLQQVVGEGEDFREHGLLNFISYPQEYSHDTLKQFLFENLVGFDSKYDPERDLPDGMTEREIRLLEGILIEDLDQVVDYPRWAQLTLLLLVGGLEYEVLVLLPDGVVISGVFTTFRLIHLGDLQVLDIHVQLIHGVGEEIYHELQVLDPLRGCDLPRVGCRFTTPIRHNISQQQMHGEDDGSSDVPDGGFLCHHKLPEWVIQGLH